MRGGLGGRAHFLQRDRDPALGQLPGGLAASKATTNYKNRAKC